MRKVNRINRICQNCNAEFLIERWRLNNPQRGKYCSVLCQREFHSGEKSHYYGNSLKGENSPAWKGGKPFCKDCGVELSAYTYTRCLSCCFKIRGGRNHYSFEKPRLNFRGSNNPNWKGGKRKRHLEMGRIEYVLWRTAIFMRDDYTCVWCGERGKKLNADHIKSWAKYPELRYAIDNGRTLCIECHYQTDSYPKQFIPKEVKN